MPTQLPPTTAQDLDRGRIPSPCHNPHLELTSPPNKYECRECAAEYVIPDGADAPAEGEGSESASDEGDSSERVEKYVDDGLCGFYNPETMEKPCGRSAGWGMDADSGPCKQHADEV